jgi:hypothetical protein
LISGSGVADLGLCGRVVYGDAPPLWFDHLDWYEFIELIINPKLYRP